MVKFTLVVLPMFMSVGANLSEGFLFRLGIDPDILLVALIAFVVTGMIYHHPIALIVLVVLMSFAANVSQETALAMGYNPDYMLAGLVAIVVTPFISKQMNGDVF